MAACPAPLPAPRRRRFVLTPKRIEANRRNATRSTGPRTNAGKARVGRNAVKHGFFVAPHRWTPEQQRNFQSTYAGLRDDFHPHGIGEESCVWTIAHSYVQMAAVFRYENEAALEYHQQCESELEAKIAAATLAEAERLREHREELRRAGLWGPTIPGPRDLGGIIRCMGRLDRRIREATSDLEGLQAIRTMLQLKAPKQTHYPAGRAAAAHRIESEKTNPLEMSSDRAPDSSLPFRGPREIEKTNPLRASVSNGPEALRRTS